MNDLNLNQQNSFPVHWEEKITQLVKSLLTPQKGECRCHWLDADKNRILAWPSTKDPNTLILKIDYQKFIGLTRSDKNDERYWKFKNVYEGSDSESAKQVSEVPSSPSESSPETKPTSKVPDSSEKISLPSSESEQVKNFRTKYGTAESH